MNRHAIASLSATLKPGDHGTRETSIRRGVRIQATTGRAIREAALDSVLWQTPILLSPLWLGSSGWAGRIEATEGSLKGSYVTHHGGDGSVPPWASVRWRRCPGTPVAGR